MKKIAIVTIYDEKNFGNRLQNYAVCRYFKKKNIKAETIVPVTTYKPYRQKVYFDKLFLILKKQSDAEKLKLKRLCNFEEFTKKNIPTKYIKSLNSEFSEKISEKYSYFVAGGDQVWNPEFMKYASYKNMMLSFVNPKKKLCFSPSIGISKIPDEWKQRMKEGFNAFGEINVREKRGAELIEELTGKKAEVFIDPTLILNKEEWEKVSSKSVGNGKKYVLEYFLGERDVEDEKVIEAYLDDGIERINVLDKNNPEAFISGPGEFIDLIKNAKVVYTDSFHACIFSIIFDIPFVVKRRKQNIGDMFSRIDNLLELFKIDKVWVEENQPIIVDKDVKKRVLKREREKVDNYFKRNLTEEFK